MIGYDGGGQCSNEWWLLFPFFQYSLKRKIKTHAIAGGIFFFSLLLATVMFHMLNRYRGLLLAKQSLMEKKKKRRNVHEKIPTAGKDNEKKL